MPTINYQMGNTVLSVVGAVLNVEIGHDSGHHSGVGNPPNLSGTPHLALIDTGARTTCIDITLTEELGLPVVGNMQQPAAGILGPGLVDVYPAQISIPELRLSVTGHFPGVYLAAGGQPYRALIGRDILRNLTMVYEGRTGVITLSND